MISLRRHRLFTILVSLFSILFMQFALAGYACSDRDARVQEAAQMAHAGMACAGSMPMAMDEEQPALCHAHCEAGQQAVDTQTFHLPAAALSGHVEWTSLPASLLTERAALQAPLLVRATSPPLSIRHCCFRI